MEDPEPGRSRDRVLSRVARPADELGPGKPCELERGVGVDTRSCLLVDQPGLAVDLDEGIRGPAVLVAERADHGLDREEPGPVQQSAKSISL
jgi:hypothetical protein